MLAYPIDEAETMLTEKLRAAEASLSNCEEDLEFLREQITVNLLLCTDSAHISRSFCFICFIRVYLCSSTRPITLPVESLTDYHVARPWK
jgi:Prefoldin subunit